MEFSLTLSYEYECKSCNHKNYTGCGIKSITIYYLLYYFVMCSLFLQVEIEKNNCL